MGVGGQRLGGTKTCTVITEQLAICAEREKEQQPDFS